MGVVLLTGYVSPYIFRSATLVTEVLFVQFLIDVRVFNLLLPPASSPLYYLPSRSMKILFAMLTVSMFVKLSMHLSLLLFWLPLH